jgi:hypothetical protein
MQSITAASSRARILFFISNSSFSDFVVPIDDKAVRVCILPLYSADFNRQAAISLA